MNYDQAVLNRVWCNTLLEELARNGVEHVCVAPGSRSTPLTLEAEANPKLTLHTHFDERGLGFLALGLAKASDKPVAVIVTSGTAVANLLPATAESGLTREKLILLTSDRPIDLVDCGANQAIQQQGIFSSHVETALNLPSPTTRISLNWLLTSVDKALAKQRSVGGAIHINCPFPEPLYSANSAEIYADYTKSVVGWNTSTSPYSNTCLPNHFNVHPVAPGDYVTRKGVVIIGSIDKKAAKKVQQFASTLGWPVFCDPQSGITSDWKHYDLWMQIDVAKEQLNQCDFILQFGERIVSKRLNQWLKWQAVLFDASQYIVVSPDTHRINQDHLPQTHIGADIESWVSEQHLPTLLGQHAGWAAPLVEIANTVQQLALAQISNNDQLTELSVAVDLSTRLKDRELFVGNSLMVRLVDMLSSISANQVYSNRGASGIDGLVATAAGVVKANQNPLLMLIGDTSLLYDLNSLALLTHNVTPMVIVVTNNNGGAIFDLLPVPEQQKQSLYQMPHGFGFEHAAAQFQLGYAAPETLNGYQTIIEQHFEQGQGTLIVEVKTPPEQASTLLKQFSSMLTEALA
ncbi:2-succinyl-5-enolpyruvyl-6-hydroxy-3-cyclohexene-1-carboxylic-acid synthase [Vibrio cyclitrophicus]|uniref:2-succinyl-5-enolpyruvyl-6-hydroxy-3- cyclohexene-1-carboxylic-acid synthase n=1 Tax=Vibrio cyclitrophicus TaxID=47951 RepID=UPI00029A8123|nr:2-succinyl-5-enolpyruvyl-6-hydroxy-3-cyclohexene-1-carboxylic-acid synthase [Vibrio cyclitrophicus]KAA8597566.1 2-succinyl-5-enolpyruvyl-6-hydroxy-3- cyclohexene-1-carboxylic-acid synthase [Vibrio cyclitrophicus]KNH12312.1 2-succinyl-5-enolpyruvyl-6-hydroxy-3-cyclohexene-1-carboxylate synthase [Vibrio lentus]OEE25770.1 2-succinyl-5-enolpyruvyl-6-hydroxy-3-cyclohexene-1-carboxylic-acid synthase [Vibrio cyclitrophicus ZF14]